MPRRTRVGVEVQLYCFFNLGARWGGRLTPRHGRFISGKETRYPLYRRLGGPQGWSGRVRKILTPPEFDPRTIHTPAGRCTDWAIQAPINMYRYDSCSNKGFTEKWKTHFMSKCCFHCSRHNWHKTSSFLLSPRQTCCLQMSDTRDGTELSTHVTEPDKWQYD
jgi:hypothetical protein